MASRKKNKTKPGKVQAAIGDLPIPASTKSRPTIIGLGKFALILALTLAAYWPASQAGFIWDDDAYVENNQTLRSGTGLAQIWFQIDATPQYYPLVHTSYWMEYHLWGLNPFGYHLVNILLHALSSILLWQILKFLGLPGAWLAGIMFALHPVCVESVAWVTERKNTLSGVFFFASLLTYLRMAFPSVPFSNRRKNILYATSLILFMCALFSKTVTCSLPAVILLIIWWKHHRVSAKDVVRLMPFFAIGLTMGLVTAWLEKTHVGASGASWDLSIVDRVLIASRALVFYASSIVWPTSLTFIYPRWQIDSSVWWQYLFPVGVTLFILSLWLLRHRISRGPVVCTLIFSGMLVPALGFFDVYPMRFSFVADHFQYLPSAAIMVLIVGVSSSLIARMNIRKPWLERGAGMALLAVFASLTWHQGQAYADRETLWRDTIDKNPACWLAHFNLGKELIDQNRTDEAMESFNQVVEINPDYAYSYDSLGNALLKKGRFSEAMSQFKKALVVNPNLTKAHFSYGNALASYGRFSDAAKHFQLSLEGTKGDAQVYENIGSSFLALGRTQDAIPMYEKALSLNENLAGVHSNLGLANQMLGDTNLAINHYQQALKIDPNHNQAQRNLQDAQRSLGKAALGS